MGSCVSGSKVKQEALLDLTRKFDSFDFRINPTDKFTFIERAKRELSGSCAPDEFMSKIYSGYREFMINTALSLVFKGKNKDGNFVAPFTPAPLIDEMWCLAILYSRKYRELCKCLVGGFIDRVPLRNLNGTKMFKQIWPDYDDNLYKLDSKYMVWIYNRDICEFLNIAYDGILGLKKSNLIIVEKKELKSYVKVIYDLATDMFKNINLDRSELTIPVSHNSFNDGMKESPLEIYDKILISLPKNFTQLIQRKYCLGNKSSIFINEYARFMTMIYFSKQVLTPSEEIDQVWHTHQTLTILYRKFCFKIYGKFIDHTPTVGGSKDAVKHYNYYNQTIEFYKYIFKDSPPLGIWPRACDRFNPVNIVGSFYSLLRIFLSIIRVLDMVKDTRPADAPLEILSCYFSWTGRNIFKKKLYVINLQSYLKLRDGLDKSNYWHAGGCSIINRFGSGCGAGCGGGCGVGCGGSGYCGCQSAGCGGIGCAGCGSECDDYIYSD